MESDSYPRSRVLQSPIWARWRVFPFEPQARRARRLTKYLGWFLRVSDLDDRLSF